jgi:hypothetical protein
MAYSAEREWRKASKSCQKILLSYSKEYSAEAARLFTGAAEGFLRAAEMGQGALVPYYTGNLLDSIGVRVLKGSTIVAIRTMTEVTSQHATKPQHMRGVQGDIWGEFELEKRITRPSRRTSKGVVSQLMIGVPYAENVDIKDDYFDALRDLFEGRMTEAIAYLNQYKRYGVKAPIGLLQ